MAQTCMITCYQKSRAWLGPAVKMCFNFAVRYVLSLLPPGEDVGSSLACRVWSTASAHYENGKEN